MKPGLNLVVIRAADLKVARTFYEPLGLEFTAHRHGTGPVHLACELDGLVFEIYPAKENSTADTRLGLSVSSVDELVAKLRDSGSRVVTEPSDSEWGRRAVVCDPDGHRVELTESA
ncbi:MAG: lactoylglutathione lyase [Limisphaerales bacterium]